MARQGPAAAHLQAAASATDLQCHCRCLLKKLLFLGRTLLLRLWVLRTHVRKRLGRLGEQPAQLGASNRVLIQENSLLMHECWCQASKPVMAQHFVLGGLRTPKGDFGSLLKLLLF